MGFSALLLTLLLAPLLEAQVSELRLGTGSGGDGDAVTVSVEVESDLAIDGFAFGVSHLGSELTLTSVVAGAVIDPLQGGLDPDFLSLDAAPAGGPGAVIGCIIRFALDLQLPPIVTHSVVDLTYEVVAGSGEGASVLSFTDLLGNPPIEVMVVSGLQEMIPTQISGSIVRLGEDCNGNGVADSADLLAGTSDDCDGNAIPDECDLAVGMLDDCDGDLIPDSCAIAAGQVADCDGDGVPDSCQITAGTAADCDLDGVLDSCEIMTGQEVDCDLDGIPDSCELLSGAEADCDGNGEIDGCQIAAGTALDCDLDGLIDSCAIAAATVPDCDLNGIPDSCDIANGAPDLDLDGIPDVCQPVGAQFVRTDCNSDGGVSIADPIFLLTYLFIAGPDSPCFAACDFGDDGALDISDAISSLSYQFVSGPAPLAPFPDCDVDPTPGGPLDCVAPPACP